MTTSVREAMTNNPQSVEASTPVLEAAKLLKQLDVGSLPTLDDGRLVGQGGLRHPGRRVLLGVVATLPPGCRGNRHDQEGQNASQPIISGRHGTNLYTRTRNRRSARRRSSRN